MLSIDNIKLNHNLMDSCCNLLNNYGLTEFEKQKIEVESADLESKPKSLLNQEHEDVSMRCEITRSEYQQVLWCLVAEVGLLSFIQRVCRLRYRSLTTQLLLRGHSFQNTLKKSPKPGCVETEKNMTFFTI